MLLSIAIQFLRNAVRKRFKTNFLDSRIPQLIAQTSGERQMSTSFHCFEHSDNGHVCQSDGVEEPVLLHTLIGKSIANHRSPTPAHDEIQLRDRVRALKAEYDQSPTE